jgi:hypothetical protein
MSTIVRGRLLAVSIILCAVSFSAHAQSQDKAPVITFGPTTVIATGIAPGGDAVFFGVSYHGPGGSNWLIRWRRVVSDDDHDGTVILDLGADYSLSSSLWTVVDMANAHYAIKAYVDASYNDAYNPPQPFSHSSPPGQVDRFEFHRPLLDALYVHPGLGAWTWIASDGSSSDKDGRPNGVTTIELSGGRPLKGSKTPPQGFVPGGLIIAIDWWHMDVLALRVNEALLAGAR